MNRTVVLLVAAVATLAWAARPADPGPRLRFAEPAPADVRALATDVWGRFLAAFPARVDCLPDVTVRGAWTLPHLAEYRPATATIVLRIPRSSRRLTESLTHELAHHLEHGCPDHAGMRPAFLAAIGAPPDAGWSASPDGRWGGAPSEQWAETVIEHVHGSRLGITAVDVDSDALAVVAAWSAGGLR